MAAPADELEQRLERDRAGLGDLGFGRTAPAHRDDDRIEPVRRGHARGLARNGGLARSLPDPDHRDRRDGERSLVDRRVEPEVGTEVGDAPGQRHGGDLHPLAVPEHGFVRQVEDPLGGELVDRAGERRRHRTVRDRTAQRDPEVERGRRVELLAAAREQRRDRIEPAPAQLVDRPARDGRVVLTVDEDDDLHPMGSFGAVRFGARTPPGEPRGGGAAAPAARARDGTAPRSTAGSARSRCPRRTGTCA